MVIFGSYFYIFLYDVSRKKKLTASFVYKINEVSALDALMIHSCSSCCLLFYATPFTDEEVRDLHKQSEICKVITSTVVWNMQIVNIDTVISTTAF